MGNLSRTGEELSGTLSARSQLSGGLSNGRSVVGALQYGSGSSDYNKLTNKPSIESVPLVGNKTFSELGMSPMTALEIQAILQS